MGQQRDVSGKAGGGDQKVGFEGQVQLTSHSFRRQCSSLVMALKAVQLTSHSFEGSAVLVMDGTEDLLENGKHCYR